MLNFPMDSEIPKGYTTSFDQSLIGVEVYYSHDSRDYLIVSNGYHLHLGADAVNDIATKYSPLEVMMEIEKFYPDFAKATFEHKDIQQRTLPGILSLALARVRIKELAEELELFHKIE